MEEKFEIVYNQNEEKTKEKVNLFTKSLGNKYARLFEELYNSDLRNRNIKLKEIIDYAAEDNELDEKQKIIFNLSNVRYLSAIGQNTIPSPILAYMIESKPNLKKSIKKIRLKRIYEDLESFVSRTGFDYDLNTLPENIRSLCNYFKKDSLELWNEMHNNDYEYELYIIACISKLVRKLSPEDYLSQWYYINFLKNIELLSNIPSDIYKEEKVKTSLQNTGKILNYIYFLEMKRQGKTFIEQK